MSVPFTIMSDGRRFDGRYRVDGHHLEVLTAYGAKRVPLGLERPLKLAKALYRAILRDVAGSPARVLPEVAQEKRVSNLH